MIPSRLTAGNFLTVTGASWLSTLPPFRLIVTMPARFVASEKIKVQLYEHMYIFLCLYSHYGIDLPVTTSLRLKLKVLMGATACLFVCLQQHVMCPFPSETRMHFCPRVIWVV